MKTLYCISFILFLSLSFVAQEQRKIKWLSLKEAIEQNKKQPRKIIIDMYTDWCGWCKKMDAETFNHPAIANFINENFYAVKFNAETKDTIEFKGKKYSNPGLGFRSTHSLALELMNNRASYPTIVYLDEQLNNISAVPGYMTPADIEPVLIFFARNFYKVYPFDQFKKDFDKAFRDTAKFHDKIIWQSFDKGLKSNKKKIIFMYFNGCIDCAMMQRVIFQHDTIANILNNKFSIISFDVLTTDSIRFNDILYINEKKEHPFHQLAITLTNAQITLPGMVFLSENNQLISYVPGFFPLKTMEMLLHFFYTEAYKTQTWEQFTKTFKSNITP
ncbi:MAG: thioredoxin fold domain-containing protein [Bacteroidales bacterium]|nr:thioredoxin fold domain-containing protein [Bacteroidales bacterium]